MDCGEPAKWHLRDKQDKNQPNFQSLRKLDGG
jgi:hypothetical protein